jgi:ribonuclease HIII
MPETNYVCKLSEQQANKLRDILSGSLWDIDKIPYSNWRAKKNKTIITSYMSGKLCIQGKGTSDVVQFVIEPQILEEAKFGYESQLATLEDPEMFKPHGGIDESGKGDYFGPLVIAAVYVNEETSKHLLEAGIQDSKNIKSDKKISVLAKKIRDTTKGSYAVVPIGPEAYNRLYTKTANLNKILAWGHAKVLENLLEKEPDCKRAISDKFGKKSSVIDALMSRGKKIKLEQRTKAESDIAVAAASILARDEFVRRLNDLSGKVNMTLPKGASAKVLECASRLLADLGEEELGNYAKLHFRTTEKAKFKG